MNMYSSCESILEHDENVNNEKRHDANNEEGFYVRVPRPVESQQQGETGVHLDLAVGSIQVVPADKYLKLLRQVKK